jgi:hypothetical protein
MSGIISERVSGIEQRGFQNSHLETGSQVIAATLSHGRRRLSLSQHLNVNVHYHSRPELASRKFPEPDFWPAGATKGSPDFHRENNRWMAA